MEILEIAKEFFNKTIVTSIADRIGDDVPVVEKAMNAVLPSILAGIMEKGSTAGGAQQLISLINKNDEESTLNTFSSSISEKGQLDHLVYPGYAILESLFGKKVEKVEGAVSEQSGISKTGASMLLNIAAPVLLSLIGKHFKTSGMGVSGLVSLLMSQKDAVKTALPLDLQHYFSDLGDYRGDIMSTGRHVRQYAHNNNDNGNRMPGWLPWLVGVLLVVAGLWMFKTCKQEKAITLESTTMKTDSLSDVSVMADSVVSNVGTGIESLGNFFKRKLPNGVELNVPEHGVESKLIAFIEDNTKPVDVTTWFNFDRINFETGSAKLSSESMEQTKNIGDLLKAFPDVSVKIGGYTDNTGNEELNLKLSHERAKAVKDAIVAEGIQADRVEAEGYGKMHPVASNDTEEGRAQNRRIAIRVVEK